MVSAVLGQKDGPHHAATATPPPLSNAGIDRERRSCFLNALYPSHAIAMTRSRVTKHRLDEKRLPVRGRVAVPVGGFGTLDSAIAVYLDRECGRDG